MSRTFLCASLFVLGGGLSASSQEGEPRFLEDDGHIVILEHDGESYDRDTETGELNVAPRGRIAQTLIDTHGDFYDFIVVFTNFDFDRGGAIGFYTNVRNDVQGINLPVVDNGDAFGSPGRLQGFIDMGPIDQYRREPFSLEPGNPDFRTTLGVLAHEIGHRWLAGVRFDTGSGPRNDLLGKDDAHWSFLLSSDASFLYGNAWEPAGGNLYRSVEVQSRFSELDLYLMGFLSPEEVSPFTLLVNPEVDATRLPELGAEIEALTVETISLDHILAVEGPRRPTHEGSQKDFSIAFVFLTAEGLLPASTDLEGVERIRSSFMETFFGLTRGRALADPDLHPVAPITPGAMPDTSLALTWLLSQQQPDGRFEANPLTAVRDTSTAISALATLGVRGPPVDDARAWLSLRDPASVDYLARALSAGAAVSSDRLLSLRNGDGGFGIARGYRSDALDTALALQALVGSEASSATAETLGSMQRLDGGFSSISGQPADVMTTSEAALALARAGNHEPAVQSALAWLVEHQQLDGGLGDGPSAPHTTARALEAFSSGTAPPAAIDRAIAYLQQTQRSDGSWNESVFETAAVLRALVPSTFANLSIETTDVRLDPDPPEVGETVTVEVTVRNRARVPAGAFDVQLFDGDPEAGGIAIGAPQMLEGLGAGSTRVLTFSWDTTGLEGPHTLFAVADFAGVVPEVSKEDNVATRDVEVLPPLPNLTVTTLMADPASPIEGSVTTLTAGIENEGSVASSVTEARFFRELPRLGIVLGTAVVPALEPGESAEVSIPWDTMGELGSHTLHVRVDPDDDVRERVESDNDAAVLVDVRAPPPAQPDLEIHDFGLTPNELERLPQEVTASARIANTGLDPVPSAFVELFQGHPDLGGVRVASTSTAVAGDTGVDVSLPFTVTTGGSRTFYLRVDASPVVERDETNNLASAELRDLMDVVDVSLVPGSIALSAPTLAPGELLTVDVTVSNRGTRPLSSVPVALFYEVSSGGPFALASTVNLPLEPGESAAIQLTWTANRSGTVPLELRADPDDVLAETSEADNVLATSVDVTPSLLPNLSVASDDINATPTPLVEGAAGILRALVRNLGDVPADAFEVSFFAGDPTRDGLLLGTVLVGGLEPLAEIAVSLEWDPVNVRGDALVFVEVDSGGAVEEVDESDNLVFRVVEVKGLPELLATTAQLRVTPPFARSGDTVSIEASFTNAGDQSAAPMAVEIRLDDPAGGTLIATREVGALAPGESGGFTVDWDTTGLEGEHAIYLVLDVRNDVAEQREDNNVVRVEIALQDGDVFVAPLYFSPNGDGVQDEAALFYRVSTSGETRVEVRDARDAVVRELAPPEGTEVSVVWDGRHGDGELARDGTYFLVLLVDGAEVLRRRVVLDTNRSSVVEALGSDLVSFTQLTCPLPHSVEGPAWLPSDRAAYVIVTSADLENAPDFPVGLYRVSSDARTLELVLEDETFQDVELVDQVRGAREIRTNAVSADGEHALVRSPSAGLEILDLVTGARTALDPDDDASAMWTSDGRRILVGSANGLSFYDAEGRLLEAVVAESVYSALLAPDELRIVYRRSDEIVLRIVNTDGTGDRVLASSDATLYFEEAPTPDDLDLDELYFLESAPGPVFAWFFQTREEAAGPFLLDLGTDTVTSARFLGPISSDEDWEVGVSGSFHVVRRRGGREVRPVIPSSLGGNLTWSYRDTHLSYRGDGGEGCVGFGIWAVRALLNGEADFRLTRLPSRFGVEVAGTVSDQNLEAYRLEFASVEAPDAWTPIQPPSAVPVIADTITTWIPPGPGDYLVRLTLHDRAGNVTERLDRIFWEETLPIASIRRAPAYLSPNADGAQDELLVEYQVLAPANLVFHVRDGEGRSVREIPRDELVPGPSSFVWDGHDDLGVPVEDGSYVLEIEGAEFPVIVDRSAPVVSGSFSELYTDDSDEDNVRLAVDLDGRVVDPNLDVWEIVDRDGEILFSSRREIGSTSEDAVLLERIQPAQGYELRARDRAGNETALPLSGPSREVRIIQSKAMPVGSLEPGPALPVPRQVIPPRGHVSLKVAASFAADLVFRYHAEGSDQIIDIPTTNWVSLPADDLQLGTTYFGWFEADGLRSQDVELVVGPDAILLSAGATLVSVEIFFTNNIGEPLVEGRLLRNGSEVIQVFRPVPAQGQASVRIPLCGSRDGYVFEATGESGTLYHSTTSQNYPEPAPLVVRGEECLSVDDAGIEAQAGPGMPVSHEARANVKYAVRGNAPETLVLFVDDGASRTEVARVPGVVGTTIIPFDVEGLPEGSYRLEADALLPGGGEVEGDFALSFFFDQSPPELDILSPAEGATACVATVEGRDVLTLDVLAQDNELSFVDVELLQPGGTWTPLPILDRPELPRDRISGDLQVLVPDDLSGETSLRLVVRNSRIAGELAERPPPFLPAPWPNRANNGGLYNTLVRTLVVSPTLGLGPVTTEPTAPALFSPNSDGVDDLMRVHGDALEAVTLTARVYTAGPSQVLVRTIVSEEPTSVGTFSVDWDGRDDDGFFVADGDYEIELEAVNGCGGLSVVSAHVEVDNTGPEVAIDNLVDDQPINIGVDVVGTASDPHFDHYVLELGEGRAPLSFTEIAPGVRRRVEGETLGHWSVGSLEPGIYTLRLSASDIVGNLAFTTVRVEVRDSDFIAAHEVVPALFSPNTDGVQDETEARFELEAEARVTLTIRDSTEALIATLVDAAVLPAGAHVAIWDGAGAPNGDYVAFLHAEHPTTSTLFEESSFDVAVDTRPPVIEIGSPPADGFVAAPSPLSGGITDDHLERFEIGIGPTLASLTTVAEDTLPVTGVITTLRALADGSYELRATASDRAGNTAEVSFSFGVDSESPVVSLTAPPSGSFITRDPDELAVTGVVEDANLDRYDLEVGFGDPPGVFVPLAGSSTLPSEPILATWDLEALPDGPYTLRLSAIDSASNFAVTESRVTLDTTAPTVTIALPEPNAVVSDPIAVTGTVTDANFGTGRLFVAPADRPAQLTEIGTFSSPVASGVLVPTLALADGSYVLELRAEDAAGNVASTSTPFSVDTEPPLPPSALTATAEGTDVTLAWNASPSSDVVGYHVSRDGVRITASPVPTPSYLDAALGEGVYRYTVTAVDAAELESEPSEPATVTIDLTPPTTVLRSPDEGDRVRVEVDVIGTAFSEDDFHEYRLSVAPIETPMSGTLLKRSSVPVSFDTLARWQPLADGDYLLILEAEDTSGNLAEDRVRVTVDNRPPGAPTLIRAEALPDPDDVEIEWSDPDDDDIEGFLVFRNGQIANAPGPVTGNLRPFLVPGPIYVDPDLPDGEHCYRVVAMDLAGNLSSDSNELCVLLDNRAPAAVIIDPENGARFDAPRAIRAESEDLDVATVQFEYQAAGAVVWTTIAIDDDGAPFETLWDINGFDFGDYRLRAVATDIGTRSDPAPASIDVVLADVTPPAAPENLTARVVGDAVELEWTAVDADDLAGYRIFRGETVVLEPTAGDVSATDAGVPDGDYEYTIRAVDADGNESEPSNTAPARVYAPTLLPPFPIVEAASVAVSGDGAEPGATVNLFDAGTTEMAATATADAGGRFDFPALVLALGPNLFEAEATDEAGNVSRRSTEALLIRNEAPAPPTGFTAVADDDEARLSWSSNTEEDLSGYLVTRDGDVVNPRGLLRPTGAIPTDHEARASVNDSFASRVLGSFSSWFMGADEEAWIEVELAEPRHLDEVRLSWASQRAAKDFDLLVELEGRLVPVVRVRDQAPAFATAHPMPMPLQTTRVRLQIYSSATGFSIFLDELELIGILPEASTAFTDRPSSPDHYEYRVEAIDTFGGRSEPAGPIELGVGDLIPPEPPTTLEVAVDGADVTLTWAASPSPDVVRYRLYRDGELLREVTSTFHIDRNLLNGTYAYHVTAIDAAGNESVPSNAAEAEVNVSPPSAPVLTVTPLPEGGALALEWTESVGSLGVSSYVVSRSAVSGGPYTEIASVNGATFALVDRDLENGVELFYVVRAVDLRGQPSDDSNEASGTPTDAVAPPAPLWGTPSSPLTLTRSRIDLLGISEPASTVTVLRDGAPIGSTMASDSFTLVSEAIVRTRFNASGRFALSPDRTRVAEMGTNSSFAPEARIYDLETGAVRVVAYAEDFSFERDAAFSPDGRRVAVSTTGGAPVNRALRILDLDTETTEVIDLGGDAPNTLAWLSDDGLAVVVAGADIRVFDLELGTETTIYTSSGFEPQNLTVSPDGAFLAWKESSALYVMPSSGGPPELVFDDFRLDDHVWMGPRRLAFNAFDIGVHLYDVDTAVTTLVPRTEDFHTLRSVVPGVVSAFESDALSWILADGSVIELGEPPNPFDPGFVEWATGIGLIGVDFGSRLSVFETPGRFGHEARLEPGLNLVTARATDNAGNESPDSEALELTYHNASLADLTVDGALTIVPSVPVRGDIVSLTIPILNGGESASAESVVTVSGADAGGDLYAIGSAAIPALDSGGRFPAVVTWPTADRLGPQTLSAAIDPLGLVDEADETNNTASAEATVVGSAALELSITPGRASYAAGQTAELTVAAVNGGAEQDAILETVIEDTAGVRIALVDSRPVTLAYAESVRYPTFWTAGSVVAGAYVARVNALAGGDVVATAVAPFELTQTLAVTLDVISNRPSYEQGDAVTVLARVANTASNTPLRDLSLRYRIVDPDLDVVFEHVQPLGYLAMGGASTSEATWVSGADELGTYRVTVEALEAAELVATESTNFELSEASTVTLSGVLTLGAEAVPEGSDVVANYTIDNESVVDLAGGTVRVALVEVVTQATVASAEGALDVAGRESALGQLRIATGGVELGSYTVVLSAGAGPLEGLATAPVTLFRTPAAPSLNAPADGASAQQQLSLSVNNATNPNEETLTYEFELYLDPALTVRIQTASGLSEGASTTAWLVRQSLQENQHYYWRARAGDRFATSDWMMPAEVFVDSINEAPDPPTLSAPAESSEVDVLRPGIAVGNARDPENDALTYTFELYRDPELTELALAVSGVPESNGETSFTPDVDLVEDASYFWRARANDGELDGEWMPTASFRVNTANQAPGAPAPLEPTGGTVPTPTPELVVTAALDPEGDPVTHTFQIDVTDRFDSPARQESLPLDDVRWTPPGALDENTVYFWRARAQDPFAAGPWSETASFRVDAVNEPPEAPTPQRPTDGSVVESATPVLAVINAVDPEEDSLTYAFEVYADEALTTLVTSVSELPEGEAETAWAVSPRLEEETTYYWIARANDGRDGPATLPQSFRVNVMNEEPTAPTLVAPPEGSIVSDLAPTLVVANASDPDGDPLTYRFEVYDDELLAGEPVETSGEIDEGVAETSWTMTAALVENQLYFWRVRAFDKRLESAWMATARFRFSLANEAPTRPVNLEPADGDVIAESEPTLVVAPSRDPEEDTVRYTFELFRDAALSDLVTRSPETEETSWPVDAVLDENETYYWHAVASDGDRSSAPSASTRFTVNAVVEPPTVPRLVEPADGALVDTTTPALVVDNASSPDGALGEPLVYHFVLYTDAALSDVLAEDEAVPEGAASQTRWEPPVTLNAGETYYWRARTVDARGLTSAWAPSFSFIVEPPESDCPPEWRDDFERYRKHAPPAGWRLEEELEDPGFEVRTLAGSKRLMSSTSGSGSLLFAGNGEAYDWRNYELDGELRKNGNANGKSRKKGCAFATGVAFYARPVEGSAYRFELTEPFCKKPKARLVKILGEKQVELARIYLDRHYNQHPLGFHIEVSNGLGSTNLYVRLRGRIGKNHREWTLGASDADAPLRSGTVGAWSSFVRSAWDDFHVRELHGFSSGISGDADGDGVCDVEADDSALIGIPGGDGS